MQTHRSELRIGSLLVVCAVAGFAAQAEDYPTRSVKLITQGAAASGPDVIARIVAEHLGRLWGQQVVDTEPSRSGRQRCSPPGGIGRCGRLHPLHASYVRLHRHAAGVSKSAVRS